ncbi:MAG: hypothetical protein WAX04_10135 [Oscillospiraceae bacterium]
MNKHCAVITAFKSPLYIESICKKLGIQGITTRLYNWDSIDDNDLFDVTINPIIIIADALNCPAYMPNLIKYYLSIGGKVVTLGGPPFKNEFYSLNNVEVDYRELARRLSIGEFDKKVILAFNSPTDLEGFEKNTYNPDSKKYEGSAYLSIAKDGVTSEKCMRYYTDNFSINESFEKHIRITNGHNVIGFWAKAFENTRTISIELIDKNGDMFKTRITPSANFKYFMLSKKDFVFTGNRNGVLYDDNNRPTCVNFAKVEKIQFGHALSHSYSIAGEHCFFIDELASGCISVLNDEFISIDGLCPEYKFYPVTNAVSVKSYSKQAIISDTSFPVPTDIFSLSPRAQATGIDKARRFRFIPLIEAYDEKEIRCGYLAYMLLNYSYGERCSSQDGSSILVFTTRSDEFYLNGGEDAVVEAIIYMLSPVLLLEGGCDEYIHLDDCENATFGAVILARTDADTDGYKVKIQINNVANIYSINELSTIKLQHNYDFKRVSFNQLPCDCSIVVSLLYNDVVCDILKSNLCIHRLKQPEQRAFAHIEKGTNEVYIGDIPVRFFGINYMPSANTGMETWDEFEHYVSAFAYDPDIIEADLKRISDIGINSLSIFMHYSPCIDSNNILHLVNLCAQYGLYVNLSLRPSADPFHFNEEQVREMIKKYQFDKNDTIVGYDIAWERYVGTYNECYGNFDGRKTFDKGFGEFILNRYESYENAQRLFQCDLPRNSKGQVIGLSDDMLRQDGTHTLLVSAYRCYIDSVVAYTHNKACDFIKSVDPNHMISARSGDASTIPLVDAGIYGYDYKALSLSLDFMSPESYALTDNYKNMRQGVFTNIYSRYANPDNVVQWMEFGKSVWIGSNFSDNSKSFEFQATYFKKFFDMLILGHTSGLYAWWWAGGYRVGENSDFGIISPDGSDRPVTKVFREYSKKFLYADRLASPSYQIHIDRDKHSDGLMSMYNSIEDELFDALSRGETVEFIDGAYGKTSADVDLIEVGNLEKQGYSPKYLNSIVTSITAILDNGTKISVKNGDDLDVGKSKAVTFTFRLINSEKAIWLPCDYYGSVSLLSQTASAYNFKLPLYANVNQRGIAEFNIAINCEKKGKLSCVLNSKYRTNFGERINVMIK